MAKLKVLRKVKNGIEFYTITTTGESGLSITGLAMLCGVTQQAVSKLLANSVTTKSPFESLEHLHGKDFTLQLGGDFQNAVIVADWACRCVIEYFAFDAKAPKKEARQVARSFMQAGVRKWIHQVTGWEEKTVPASTDLIAFLVAGITRKPKTWEVHFNPGWIREAERLTGWSWQWSCMSGFINRSVYFVLPVEFRQRLDEVNPILHHGKRARKQHQHVAPSIDETVLKQIIAETLGMMRGSVSLQDYWRSHQNAYSNGIQLTLMIGGKNQCLNELKPITEPIATTELKEK